MDRILTKDRFDREDLIALLSADEVDSAALLRTAGETKERFVGNKVYFRGLIEYSNRCIKNCHCCGIRSGHVRVARYQMTGEEVLQAARYAWENGYASIVLQSGERRDEGFVSDVERLIGEIQAMARNDLHITLSLGEQKPETYLRWFRAGAHRYLLRIEASGAELYRKLHPDDRRHAHQDRLEALKSLRAAGYQVGTGVMIGLPFQTVADLADDLLFFRNQDIDMVGMGPYVEHRDTPLYRFRHGLWPARVRFLMSLKMIAILRLMMKDINIAATTALQAIDPAGRECGLKAGANVIMPNLTPTRYRRDYLLYENKPCLNEGAAECKSCLETRIRSAGGTIAYGEWGDARHFARRIALER